MIVSFFLFLNRFFRPPRVGGRESEAAYSAWEREEGLRLAGGYLEPAGDLRGRTVLDVGCGLGGKAIAYGEGGASIVVGVDIDEDNIEAARRFALAENHAFGWCFIQADASELPLSDGSVDTVVANDAMEHFAEPDRALGEMARVAREGGAVWIFFTPHFSPLGSHLYDYIYIPWCHILMSRSLIESVLGKILERRMARATQTEREERLRELLRYYDEDLNRMTIGRFLRMVESRAELARSFVEFVPPKHRFLKPLTRVPLLRELFTATVICRMTKKGTTFP